jgi:hypothetical protein
MKTAGDILNDKKRDMVTVRPEQSIREALERMQVNRIGASGPSGTWPATS